MAGPSLSERMGYTASDRLLIVNCDDLGVSHSANLAIADALQGGLATSATLMVPCPWALDAVRRCQGFGIGVHLTLTCEFETYRWRSLTGDASLHDAEAFLPSTIEAVWERATLAAVEAECRAQIDQALAWGVDVTHLDSHMCTLQYRQDFFGIYLKLARDYRLPMRMEDAAGEAKTGFAARAAAAEAGIVFPDHFVSPEWGKPTRAAFREAIAGLQPGVTEINLHPVADGPELRGYDPVDADVRAGDCETVFDAEARRLMRQRDVKCIGFWPLRDAMRAGHMGEITP